MCFLCLYGKFLENTPVPILDRCLSFVRGQGPIFQPQLNHVATWPMCMRQRENLPIINSQY